MKTTKQSLTGTELDNYLVFHMLAALVLFSDSKRSDKSYN
jgi:hypothetical protein